MIRIPPPAIRHLSRTLFSGASSTPSFLSSSPSSLYSYSSRTFTSSPIASSSISSILSSNCAEWPLKDAVKFARPVSGTDKSTVWTFHELSSHVNALASGMNGLGYTTGDRIVSTLPAHTPESAVLLLACAKLGVTIISIPTPDSAILETVPKVEQAIQDHNAKGLFVTGDRVDDSIVSSVNATLHALDPQVALRDAAGIAGSVGVTGRPFRSSKFPSLRHVVHSGPDNARAAITFRSLLVYNENASATAVNDTPEASKPLIVADDTSVTEADIVSSAKKAVAILALSADHGAKNGTVIVRADGSTKAAAHAVAALMRQALWVSPHPDAVEELKVDSNNLIV